MTKGPALVLTLLLATALAGWLSPAFPDELPAPAVDPAVSAAIQRLQKGDAKERADAAEKLGDFGPEARQAVAPLLGALSKETDARVQIAILVALRRIGASDRPVIDALVGRLIDPDAGVRQAAAEALGNVGPDAAAARALIDLMKRESEPAVRQAAVAALAGIGPALQDVDVVGPLGGYLKDEDPLVRLSALEGLQQLGPQARGAVRPLAQALADKAGAVRAAAAKALQAIGPDAGEAVPALVACLEDARWDVRDAASAALVAVGPDAVGPLAEMLRKGKFTKARRAAAECLGEIYPVGDAARDALTAALRDSQVPADVREAAATALGNVRPGPDASAAVQALGDAVAEDADVRVRAAAALALGRLGPDAEAVVSVLVQALHSPDVDLRRAAARSFGDIFSPRPDVREALIAALNDPDDGVKQDGAFALKVYGTDARGAVPALTRLLGSGGPGLLRLNALRALANIDPSDPEAVSAFLGALDDPDANVRQEAAEALRYAGPADQKRVADRLKDVVLSEKADPKERKSAADSLGLLGSAAAGAAARLRGALPDLPAGLRVAVAAALVRIDRDVNGVELLRKDLSNPSPDIRQAAAVALGEIGPEAGQAVRDLTQALNGDREPSVRRAAAAALGQIGADAWHATPDFVRILKKDDDPLHQEALDAIRSICHEVQDTSAIPTLTRQADDLSSFEAGLTDERRRGDIAMAVEALRDARDRLQTIKALEDQTSRTWWSVGVVVVLVVAVFVFVLVSRVWPQAWVRVNGRIEAFDRWLSLRLGRKAVIGLHLPFVGLLSPREQTRKKAVEWEVAQAEVQMKGLFPDPAPFRRAGIEIAHRCRQATTVSGDFYQFIEMEDGAVGVYAVDVEGHGLAAANRAALLYETLQNDTLRRDGGDGRWGVRGGPRDQLARADELVRDGVLFQKGKDAFCMNFTKIDLEGGRVSYANAGMPYALLYRRGQPVVHPGERGQPVPYLDARGLLIGSGYARHTTRSAEVIVPFEDGDLLVIVSDGVLEAEGLRGGLFGRDGVHRVVSGAWTRPPPEIVEEILQAAARHTGRREPDPDPEDDQTVIVMRLARVTTRDLVNPGGGAPPANFDAVQEEIGRYAVGRAGFSERRARQVEVAAYEATKNTMQHGSQGGEHVRVRFAWLGLAGADSRLQVEWLQPRAWPDGAERLGSAARMALHAKRSFPRPVERAITLGGTNTMLLYADRIDVADEGRLQLLEFSPVVVAVGPWRGPRRPLVEAG